MSEGSGGIIKDTPLGDIQVYREYKPTKDEIEYTIYFRLDGNKCRMDIYGKKELWDRITNDPEGPGLENFMHDTMKMLLDEGNYIGATGFATSDYKGYRIG